jgi:HAE1 family hydrophobic/amphiphilic exporter-1
VIEKIPGSDNVRLSVEQGSPEYKIIPDKDKMQRLGLTTSLCWYEFKNSVYWK